jgi:phage terminase large subunit-like protein
MIQALLPAEHRKHGEVIQFFLALMAVLERQGLRPIADLIEDAANGPDVCQLLRRQVPGLIAIPPKDSMASRANSVALLVEAARCGLPARPNPLWRSCWPFRPEAVWTTRWIPSARAYSG